MIPSWIINHGRAAPGVDDGIIPSRNVERVVVESRRNIRMRAVKNDGGFASREEVRMRIRARHVPPQNSQTLRAVFFNQQRKMTDFGLAGEMIVAETVRLREIQQLINVILLSVRRAVHV